MSVCRSTRSGRPANSSQQPTTCRSSARRFRGSSGATLCVAPLGCEGTWRLSERTLARRIHERRSRRIQAYDNFVPESILLPTLGLQLPEAIYSGPTVDDRDHPDLYAPEITSGRATAERLASRGGDRGGPSLR